MLIITASQDDGSGNGLTHGNEIIFKIWDKEAQKEKTIITSEYFNIRNGASVAPPTFEGDVDYGVRLSAVSIETRTITLTEG